MTRILLLLFLWMAFLPLYSQEERIANPKEKTIHIVSVQKIFSENYKGYTFQYSEFLDSSDDFIIPASFSFGNYRLKEETLQKKGFQLVDRFLLGAGADGYIKIWSGVYVGIGLHIPFGYERTRSFQDIIQHKFLIGLEANQGVRIMPWKELGLVFGINFNQHFCTSRVLSKELGYELEFGINF